jgi:catechol 2,3-dioxygenase
LKVADLDRAIAFYQDILGFAVKIYGPDFGLPAAFLAAGNYHHHIGLNTFHSENGTAPLAGHTGLYHVAFLYPNRRELARALQNISHHHYPVSHAQDHGGTVSLYLKDPDGNGIELYYDRPMEQWFDNQGKLILKAEPFDPAILLNELLNDEHYI